MRAGASMLAVLLLLAAGCGERPATPPPPTAAASAPVGADVVAAWFDGAELQIETPAQRRELRRALGDLLDKPEAELRTARYAALDGTPGQRDLLQVLKNHLVPDPPRALDVDTLLAGRGSAAARAAVLRRVESLAATE